MRKDKFFQIIYSLGLLIIINAPSIKVVLSPTEAINIIGFLLIVSSFVGRMVFEEIKVTKRSIVASSLILLLFIILFMSIFWGSSHGASFSNIFQYMSIIIIAIMVLFITKTSDIFLYLKFQLLWSNYIAIHLLVFGFQLNRSLGQNYLTLGLPLGIGFVTVSGFLININKKRNIRFYSLLISIFILIFALLSLRGRAPVFFSLLTVLFYWLIYYISSGFKVKNILLFIGIGISIYWIAINYVDPELLNRIFRIFENTSDEPRVLIYTNTINLIKNNIFGYGLNSYYNLAGGNYPHNIFLEITLYGGIIALVVFLMYVAMFLLSILKILKKHEFMLLSILMVATYVFLNFNLSYGLTSAYVPFTVMSMVLSYNRNEKIEIFKEIDQS